MNIDRKKIRDRLRQLLSMTIENGASEAEALVAAEKAAALMSEHNMSFRSVEDIDAESFGPDRRDWYSGAKGRSRSAPVPFTRWCLEPLAELCGVEHSYNGWTGQLEFFGAPHDTEAAHYLEQIIRGAINREWNAFKRRRGNGSGRSSFMHAMAMRIGSRLDRMVAERAAARQESTGNALVAVKGALLKERFAKAHPRIKNTCPNPSFRDGIAANAGLSAGAKVHLGKGLNEASDAKLLSVER